MNMAYWKLKSCPRCRGDVYVENGDYNSTASCLQCGARSYALKRPNIEQALERPVEEAQRELVAAR